MSIYKYNFPTPTHFGPGARHMLAEMLRAEGLGRPLFVTDRDVAALGFFKDLCDELRTAGFEVGVFDDGGGNPVESQVKAGVASFRAHDADSVVMIGGGAPMDVAKAIALMATHPGELFDYEDGIPGAREVFASAMPFMAALPTTAGTGSEVGRSAVVSTDDTKAKKIIFGPPLLPRVVLADPELTVGLPASITASTGMDALSHNVEAFLAVGFHPMADGIALEGMRMVAQSLRRCMSHPDDIEARGAMLMASLMGAVAFQKGLGITHSLAHPLSTVCDMHHGLANGIMIRYAMEFNAEAVPERLKRMADAVGAPASPEGFLAWLNELRADVGMPDRLGEAGVSEGDLDALVHFAVLDPCHASNPRKASEADFRQIYQDAL